MKTKEKIKETKTDNKFSGLIDNLGNRAKEGLLSDYFSVLDAIEYSEYSEPIPFPYGGNQDFGKWAAS